MAEFHQKWARWQDKPLTLAVSQTIFIKLNKTEINPAYKTLFHYGWSGKASQLIDTHMNLKKMSAHGILILTSPKPTQFSEKYMDLLSCVVCPTNICLFLHIWLDPKSTIRHSFPDLHIAIFTWPSATRHMSQVSESRAALRMSQRRETTAVAMGAVIPSWMS